MQLRKLTKFTHKVFFNLECLPARVKACVTHLADEAEDAVSEALQPAALAEATSSSSSAPAAAAAGAGAAVAPGGAGGGEQRSLSPTPGGSGDRFHLTSFWSSFFRHECYESTMLLIAHAYMRVGEEQLLISRL